MSRFCGIVNLCQDNYVIYDNLLVKGILNDNKLVYKEEDISVTILLKDNKIEMKRKSHDYCIELSFCEHKPSLGMYYLKEYNQNLELQIETLSLLHNEQRIDIEYILSMEKETVGHFIFSLELEVK